MTTINPRAIFGTQTHDFSNAVELSTLKFTKLKDLPAELQARLKKSMEEVAEARAIMQEALRQKRELEKGYESNQFNPRNITSLNREETLHQIEYVSELIQSGQSENYMLSSSYQGRTTSDFRQYVYWLQQHAKELEGAKPQIEMKA